MKGLWMAASVTLLLLPVPDTVLAQETAPGANSVPAPATTASDFTLGLAYQGPTRLTGSATLMWGEPKMLMAWAPAKLFQVRVGTGGAQLGVGLVAGVFEESAWKPSGLAVTVKAIVVRTWRHPMGVTDGHSYAGIESDVVLLGIRGSIGYAWKVAGGAGPDGRFVWSLGLGL